MPVAQLQRENDWYFTITNAFDAFVAENKSTPRRHQQLFNYLVKNAEKHNIEYNPIQKTIKLFYSRALTKNAFRKRFERYFK
ncbi:MAG: hypothetical protein KZQ83_13330 [gamma proteobacterium symbiont of Taylorina sp.]|nr:hypothetical protein [gamma proteobacterium symbiont of Taylorina sp.]